MMKNNIRTQCALISMMSFVYLGCSPVGMLKPEFKEDSISRVNVDELIREASKFKAHPLLDRLIILDKVIHQFHVDGHRLTEVHQISKYLTEQPKSQVIELFFRQGYQDIQPIEAYTLIGNERIDAKVERQYPFAHLKNKWPVYKEIMLVRIQFKNVQKNAILSLRYQIHDYFSDLAPFMDGLIVLNYPFPIVKQKSLVMIPKGVELRYKLVNTSLQVKRVEKDEWQIFSIEQNWPQLTNPKQGSVEEHAGRWMFSTVTDLSAMYRRLYTLLNTHALADVSSQFEHLFAEINNQSDLLKLKKLYHLVTMQNKMTNIPTPFGVSGYIPQTPQRVLENGYAEAKDKISLLSVLLKSQNIAHTIALTDEIFHLDPEFPLFSQLNRPLIAISNQQDNIKSWQFLDAYSILVSYPSLPKSLYGRWVLLLNSTDAEFVRIPMIHDNENTINYNIKSQLDEQGNLDYSTLISSTGPYQTQQRMRILQLRLQHPNESFEESYRLNYEFLPHIQLLSARSLDPMNLEKEFQYQVEFRLKSSVFDAMQPLSESQPSDRTKLSISPDLYSHPLSSMLNNHKTVLFDLPFRHELRHQLHFHPSWKVEKYPEPIKISSPFLDYESEYQLRSDHVIEFRRILHIKNIAIKNQNENKIKQWLHKIKVHEEQKIQFKKANSN